MLAPLPVKASTDPGRASPSAVPLDDRLAIVCGLAWASGLIHVLAAIQHVDEYILFALFFALLAPTQFAWGIMLYRRPGRRLLLAGAGGSLLIAVLWVVSRTSGLPFGETPWKPEPVGTLDALATADEVVLALVALVHVAPSAAARASRSVRYAAGVAGTALILVSSLALAAGGHAH